MPGSTFAIAAAVTSALAEINTVTLTSGIVPTDNTIYNASGGRTSTLARFLIWNRSLSPSDRKAKFCAMVKNAFSFYRGACHMFFKDAKALKDTDPAKWTEFSHDTWIQGDLHTENFGISGNRVGEVVFNVNDFDESIISDYQYDVWRMATSILMSNRVHDLVPSHQEKDLVESFLSGYLNQLLTYSQNLFHKELRTFTAGNIEASPEIRARLIDVQRTGSRKKMLDKWAPIDKFFGTRGFPVTNKLGEVGDDMRFLLANGMSTYYMTLAPEVRERLPIIPFFSIKAIAKRNLAGTGSLGAGRYYVLIEGPSPDQDDDVILDFKQQNRPAPYFYMTTAWDKKYVEMFGDNDAARHNVAYSRLTRDVDPFSGYFIDKRSGDSYSVRERNPYKSGLNLKHFKGQFGTLSRIFAQMGMIISWDHCNADNLRGADELKDTEVFSPGTISKALADKLDLKPTVQLEKQADVNLLGIQPAFERTPAVRRWMSLVMEFALTYAQKTNRDYLDFKQGFIAIGDTNCMNTTFREAQPQFRSASTLMAPMDLATGAGGPPSSLPWYPLVLGTGAAAALVGIALVVALRAGKGVAIPRDGLLDPADGYHFM